MARNCPGFSAFAVFAKTRSQDRGADEGGNSANHMNGAGACEIVESHLREPAAAPDPVSGYRIDYQADEEAVDAVRREFCTLCHGSRNDGCRSGTEYCLEDQECPEGNPVGQHAAPIGRL